MRALHRPDLYGWDTFDESRDIDFNSVLWVRKEGNVAIDPVALSAHDLAHAEALGGIAVVVLTNSDHTRAAEAIAAHFGASMVGPKKERDTFPVRCDRWLGDGSEVVPDLVAIEISGSKTPGELALLLQDRTLVTGDLVRAHVPGRLGILPDAKLVDRPMAVASVRRLAALPELRTVLVGDGYCAWNDGGALLRELAASL